MNKDLIYNLNSLGMDVKSKILGKPICEQLETLRLYFCEYYCLYYNECDKNYYCPFDEVVSFDEVIS